MTDLSDSVEFGMLLVDDQGQVLLFNRWLREHARLKVDPIGHDLKTVFGSDLSPRLLASVSQALTRGHASRLSSALHPSPLPLFASSDGQRMRHAIDIVSVRGAEGRLQCLLQVREMTESYRREEVLRRQALQVKKSERRLGVTLNSAPIGMAVCSTEGVCNYANRALGQVLGLQPEELLGRRLQDWVNPLDVARDRAFWEAVVLGGSAGLQVELRWLHANGQDVWVRVTATCVDDTGEAEPYVIKQIESIDDRKRKEAQIAAALNEKETLLREVYHRVKNNLQVIQSLLSLKRRSISDAVARDALAETGERVRSMALVHEKLYQSNQLSVIDLADYLHDLVGQIDKALGASARGIRFELDVQTVNADLNSAIPFGLIVTELLSNSFKHAFAENDRGVVRVELSYQSTGARLVVADNGRGVGPEVDLLGGPSLGLKLVNNLALQIDGQFIAVPVAQGARFEVLFSRLGETAVLHRHTVPRVAVAA